MSIESASILVKDE